MLRLLFFAVPLTLFILFLPPHLMRGLSWGVFFSVTCSGLISLALSILFLSKLRDRAGEELQRWREQKRTSDDEFEDRAADHQASDDSLHADDSIK